MHEPVQLCLGREHGDEGKLERHGALTLPIEAGLQHLIVDVRRASSDVFEQWPVLIEPRWACGGEHHAWRGGIDGVPVVDKLMDADQVQQTACADIRFVGLGEVRIV